MAKSKRGGASAPQMCKTQLKACLRSGPGAHGPTARRCFTEFNACRAPKERARKAPARKGARKGARRR